VIDKDKDFDEFDFETDFADFDDTEDYVFDDDIAEEKDSSFDFSEDTEKTDKDKGLEPNLEETYQFEERANVTTADEPSSASEKKSSLKGIEGFLQKLDIKKRVMIFGGAFIVLFLLVFSFLQHSTPAKAPLVSTAAVSGGKDIPSAQGVVNNLPSASSSASSSVNQGMAAPVGSMTQVDNAALQDSAQTQKIIAALIQQNQQLMQQMQTLQGGFVQLNNQFTALAQEVQSNDSDVQNLQQTFSNVETQMTKINNALRMIVSAAATSAAPVIRSPSQGGAGAFTSNGRFNESKSYFVQAIIPGRAWLEDSQGQTITVANGDEVPGFGQVTNIDPQNGVVLTSSGIKFMYAINQN
jgi:intracellular multiplication protein IcmG